VISGDNVGTVAAVAGSVGLHQRGSGTDARELPTDTEALAEALDADTVFGRVAPEQKRGMVRALQSRDHVVGMTGDGVNDVLALRDADLGIAMGSGSPASRSVADLVLLDNRFATLPLVVEQGRKVINNVERVSNLFVVKAGYAVLLTALVGIWGVPFPFLPRQLTLIGTFSIGIPGFFLAMAPETSLVRPGLLERVMRFSIPCAIACSVATFAVYEYERDHANIDLDEARTVATMTLLAIGLTVLVVASRPIVPWKIGLAAGMAASYLGIAVIEPLRNFFELSFTTSVAAWVVAAIGVVAASCVVLVTPRLMGLDGGGETDDDPGRPTGGAGRVRYDRQP
jgi:cation-transporting ATPase E